MLHCFIVPLHLKLLKFPDCLPAHSVEGIPKFTERAQQGVTDPQVNFGMGEPSFTVH